MEAYCKAIINILHDQTKTESYTAKAAKVVEKAAGGNFDRDNM
jgi:hypothetical protein